ncbi:hypothetical protein GW17_00048244 [Ensete ventricosum]|nr:hypothetical protein GW17_00048244 [Ensete ventricosum]
MFRHIRLDCAFCSNKNGPYTRWSRLKKVLGILTREMEMTFYEASSESSTPSYLTPLMKPLGFDNVSWTMPSSVTTYKSTSVVKRIDYLLTLDVHRHSGGHGRMRVAA